MDYVTLSDRPEDGTSVALCLIGVEFFCKRRVGMRRSASSGSKVLGLALGALMIASSPLTVWADDYVPVYHPELRVSRAAGPIVIDGELNDQGWRDAARADGFAEHNPGDQTQPEVDTEVLITYDDSNLYLGWICYDDPAEVRASLCERDQMFSGDYVILCLDTFGEATLAYEISSNPYGIPGDLLFSSGNGEDITYDMNFESAGRITDLGWVSEMAIPFSSLRFPDCNEQVWRADFWRNRPRGSRYQYSWAAYDRDESCWPCQWGTITGISGVKPGAGLEILPSIVAHQTGSLNDAAEFENDEIGGDIGLGIGYDFSSELTAEVTINPDFSQVETDVAQIDVNSTFALFYPEARPFFQEGSDLFETHFDAVYTRSINDPLVAGKLTWRRGGNSVAFLSARDEHSVIILPFEESSEFIENGKSYSNILRAKKDFGEQTHIGMVATDRRFDSGGSGSLVGFDGRVRLSPSDVVLFQVLGTYTREDNNPALGDTSLQSQFFDNGKYTAALDGEEFWGHGWQVGLNREARNYGVGADYWERSPTFRAESGFEPSNNSKRAGAWVSGILRLEDSRVWDYVSSDMDIGRAWNFDGVKKDEWVRTNLSFKLRAAQAEMHSQYLYSNELFGGTQFDGIWVAHTCVSIHPGGALSFGGNVNYGHTIARRDLVMGEETKYGLWADVRPIDRMLIEVSYTRVESDAVKTGERLFDQSLLWSRLSLQFMRELSARLVLQHNDNTHTYDFDPLVTYQLSPVSLFYIGSTRHYRDLDLAEDGRDGWNLADRQYFLKMQYLFQI